ncbi:MAG: hypothetical protein M1828_004287 [Chrysothrix sp. TS-e1954]|nr:MAG: hypothetical protein M1828_004287 [Chrysothrix sp. TS-e1954]
MSELFAPFLGALQASISVLLTVSYGTVAAQFGLLSNDTTTQLSQLCVRLLLPALLLTKVGAEIRQDTVWIYVPIFLWCIIYNGFLIIYGWVAVKYFKMPSWVTPAIAFNNTTALPLLLIQSLESAGILQSILSGPDDTTASAVSRGATYLLVNSVVSNCITFAVGPQLLNAHEEDAPQEQKEKEDDEQEANGHSQEDLEQNGEPEESNEQTSLLPDAIDHHRKRTQQKGYKHGLRFWNQLPRWLQKTLDFLFQFINAPVIGTVIGLIIGLVPPLQKAFFKPGNEGGFLNAWLTNSLQNIGSLFAALQTITVGVKLTKALKAMKSGEGEGSGAYPWLPSAFVEVTRHIVCPALSIPLIWLVATRTEWLSKDPVLVFTMMLMPTGPPALKLAALADVSDYDEQEKMSISKFLCGSYCVSWVMAFAVVGSLKATEATMS